MYVKHANCNVAKRKPPLNENENEMVIITNLAIISPIQRRAFWYSSATPLDWGKSQS